MVKSLSLAAATLLAAPVVQAHYIFNICKASMKIQESLYHMLTLLCSDGQRSTDWWRVRLCPPELQHLHALFHGDHRLVRSPCPVLPYYHRLRLNLSSNDLRCNKGAQPNDGAGTYEVNAGDTIGLKVFNNEFIEHPGPGFFYMSKAPDSVSSYDGSGDWFKV